MKMRSKFFAVGCMVGLSLFPGSIDFPHAPDAEERGDLVDADAYAGSEGHVALDYRGGPAAELSESLGHDATREEPAISSPAPGP